MWHNNSCWIDAILKLLVVESTIFKHLETASSYHLEYLKPIVAAAHLNLIDSSTERCQEIIRLRDQMVREHPSTLSMKEDGTGHLGDAALLLTGCNIAKDDVGDLIRADKHSPNDECKMEQLATATKCSIIITCPECNAESIESFLVPYVSFVSSWAQQTRQDDTTFEKKGQNCRSCHCGLTNQVLSLSPRGNRRLVFVDQQGALGRTEIPTSNSIMVEGKPWDLVFVITWSGVHYHTYWRCSGDGAEWVECDEFRKSYKLGAKETLIKLPNAKLVVFAPQVAPVAAAAAPKGDNAAAGDQKGDEKAHGQTIKLELQCYNVLKDLQEVSVYSE